jgi:CRISPR-associated protein Cmr5
MQNLEQIRAAAALEPAEGLDRSAVNKLPALIIANGLLAAAAFCQAEGGGENRKGMKSAMDAIAAHLARQKLVKDSVATTKALIEDLVRRDSYHLQQATTEALAFLAYLKRFARNKE